MGRLFGHQGTCYRSSEDQPVLVKETESIVTASLSARALNRELHRDPCTRLSFGDPRMFPSSFGRTRHSLCHTEDDDIDFQQRYNTTSHRIAFFLQFPVDIRSYAPYAARRSVGMGNRRRIVSANR